MKWYVFTGACVAVLITLGILAVRERSVQWEERQALCPYCRSELARYARACRQCQRTFSWAPTSEACRWCLEKGDVDELRLRFSELDLKEGAPLPVALADFTREYFTELAEGACTYCGGLGKVKRNGGEPENCSVCRGDGRCVACGGSRVLMVGDIGAHRNLLERRAQWREAERRGKITGRELMREALVDKDVDTLRGYAEAEGLEDAQGRLLAERAADRVRAAFRALEAASPTPGAASGRSN